MSLCVTVRESERAGEAAAAAASQDDHDKAIMMSLA